MNKPYSFDATQFFFFSFLFFIVGLISLLDSEILGGGFFLLISLTLCFLSYKARSIIEYDVSDLALDCLINMAEYDLNAMNILLKIQNGDRE